MTDEDLEILAEEIVDYCNAVESAAVKLKVQIGKLFGSPKEENLDFSKLFWETKQGEKGPFEQTSEKANQNSDLWKALKQKVKDHSGFWQNNGFRYWFDMKNENVVDRRKIG